MITGIRRCGKSYLLFTLYYNYLIQSGVDASHIIAIQLDDDRNEALRDRKVLREAIDSRMVDQQTYFLFLDEVQLCQGFEGVLNGLNRNPHLDLYVTGSNSKFLSSDIITEFRGRGDEVRVYPLSFSEYLEGSGLPYSQAWNEYFTYGGLPFILTKKSDEEKSQYLKTLFEYTYVQDIKGRYHIKENNILDALIDLLASSVGSLSNPKKISDTFNSHGTKTTDVTVKSYISYLLDCFLVEKAERYDVKGKKYISTPSKYYFADIGLRNARLGFRQQEENHLMENIVFNELLIRGYEVDVGVVEVRQNVNGKLDYQQLEVDFVCNQGSKRYYLQVAFSIPDQEKMAQEQRPLMGIRDSFKKIILVKEDIKLWRNEQGITIMGLKEFLLNKDSLDL